MKVLEPIGRVRSSHRQQTGTPIQPAFGSERETATIEIDAAWREGLADLDGFGRVWVLTWLDRSPGYRPRVVPYRDTTERGVFSTRSPCRPNPIGLSCAQLLDVDAARGRIRVGDVDLLDGTPVLDVKPYLPAADAFPDAASGWFGASAERRERADDRFE